MSVGYLLVGTEYSYLPCSISPLVIAPFDLSCDPDKQLG